MESAIYIVATPIGNLSDMTFRAIDALKGVDLVAAEDTRHTRKLLDHYGVTTPMVSLHEHNESVKAESLLRAVADGGSLALVSDAGTPLISDPGYVLVDLARKKQLKVVPVPGPSALTAALSVCGVPCGRFVFEGFLPVKQKAKRDVLFSYVNEVKAVVFYESPHRILGTLELMLDVYGDRQLAVARELTKRFETVRRDNIGGLLEWMRADADQQKGEFVLVLRGSSALANDSLLEEKRNLLVRLLPELPPKKAAAIVVDVYGGAKKEIYELALQIKEKSR